MVVNMCFLGVFGHNRGGRGGQKGGPKRGSKNDVSKNHQIDGV